MKKNIEEQMNSVKVKNLSEAESVQVWQSIAARLPERKVNRFLFPLLFKQKFMLGIFIAIALVLSGAFTVQAADKAKPGDFLFPLDRAVENVQLKLASKDKQDDLKVKFAEERVDEVGEVVAEEEIEIENSQDDSDSDLSVVTSTTTASSTASVRLQNALSVAVDFINQVKLDLEASGNTEAAAKLDMVLDRLGTDIQSFPNSAKVKIKLKDDEEKMEFEVHSKERGEQKVELKLKSQTENRLRIKASDQGEFELELENEDDNSTNSSDDSSSHQSRGLAEAEAKIYSASSTWVKVEYNDREESFTVYSSLRLDIIAAIMDRYDVSQSEVEAVLKIEMESSSVNSSSDEGSDDSTSSGSHDSDDEGDDNDDSISDVGNDLSIEKIEAEVEHGQTKLRVKLIGQDDQEFNLDIIDYDELVSYLSDRYELSESEVKLLLRFEVSS